MPIDGPTALVEEFKKSGEFDRVRRDLLLEFQKDESSSAFKTRIEDIVRQRLAKAAMLHYLPQDMVLKELTQEVERYPVVERAVADVRMFSDPTFLANVESSLQKILQDDKLGGKSSTPTIEREDKDVPGEKPRTPVIENAVDAAMKSVPGPQDNGVVQQEANPSLSDGIRDSGNVAPTVPKLSSPGPPPTTATPSEILPGGGQISTAKATEPVDSPSAAGLLGDTTAGKVISDVDADDEQQDMDVDAD